MLTSSNADPAFTKNGFSNWKNAMEKTKGFQKHESSDSDMEAVARYVTPPARIIDDIGDLLSERHALEKSKNRKRKIIDSLEARTLKYFRQME